MKTATISITTRKGETKSTTWGIYQDRPYPDIEGGGGGLRWRNGGGLFGQYGHAAEGLGQKYSAVLLREGWTPESATGNRADYAGFMPYKYGDTLPALPGSIVLRGRDMGETSAEIDTRPHGCGVWFKVTGTCSPTSGERAFLDEQVKPGLLAAIEEHKAALKAEAVAGIVETVKDRIGRARAELCKMEEEAAAAIKAL